MMTPVVIQVVFWIGAALFVLVGFGEIISGMASSAGSLSRGDGGGGPFGGLAGAGLAGGALVFVGLVTLLVGPILMRISCELIIVLFRMNETLTDIRNGVGGPPRLPSA